VTDDLVYRLKKRAEIRRQISTRKSVQEGAPDRIADLLEEAAKELDAKQAKIDALMLEFCPDEMTGEQISRWVEHQREHQRVVRIATKYLSESVDTSLTEYPAEFDNE
jgi:Lhr-like helicase